MNEKSPNQYFGTKELYEVTLRANTDMTFGSRKVVEGEPILYFDHIEMSQLLESSIPRYAQGGWGNEVLITWEDKREISFTMSEGVMNEIGLGLLFSAKMLKTPASANTYIPKREGPFVGAKVIELQHTPTSAKPLFCYEFDRDCIQKKVNYQVNGNKIEIKNPDSSKEYIVDYYYLYGKEALSYLIEKERFNATFRLEGKFYTKDENEGMNITNVLVMPKVRVVSAIDLRLGEGVPPTVAVFNVVAMPGFNEDGREISMKIVRLQEDVDDEDNY